MQSITIPQFISVVRFSVVVLLKERSENRSLKSTVWKWYLSVLSIISGFGKQEQNVGKLINANFQTNKGRDKKTTRVNERLKTGNSWLKRTPPVYREGTGRQS